MDDFVELHGDRVFGDDPAIVGGLARLRGRAGRGDGPPEGPRHQGEDRRNFGMPHPEGYRKALRLMQLADKFGKPILTFIDTPGAYPGVGAEERGQARRSRGTCARWRRPTPVVAVVTGEGGSGGALALGVATGCSCWSTPSTR